MVKSIIWNICIVLLFQNVVFALPKKIHYRSQADQDKWVVEEIFNFEKGGFFIEMGASDGIYLSNTYVLEKEFGWNGICIEPNPDFFEELEKNRNCILVNDCVDGKSHKVEFKKRNKFVGNALCGGIVAEDTDNFCDEAELLQAKKQKYVISLMTKTLQQVLEENNAPSVIDYFSLDVEGSETRILRNFPFDRYTFLAMSIERVTPELNQILAKNGYVFVRNQGCDSLYVHKTINNFDAIEKEPCTQNDSWERHQERKKKSN